ncbi:MAG: hypothetical protein PWQ59_455 [Thermoanaerobacterium sp.]|nr:hypothetical protein [Thermoanaerobacterium sp.]
MVDVGKLEIFGTLNTKDIEKGFKKIEQGYNQVSGKTKGFNADMVRIGSSIGKATLAFSSLATTASGALIGIAKDAPQVAPALTEMQLAMMDLKFTLGEELAPAFDRAAGMFQNLVDTFKESGGAEFANSFFMGVLDFFEGLGNTIGWVIDQGEKFVNFFQGQGFKTKEELGEEPSLKTEEGQNVARTLGTVTAAGVTAGATIWTGSKIVNFFPKLFGGGGGAAGKAAGATAGTTTATGGVGMIIPTVVLDLFYSLANPFSSFSFANKEQANGYSFGNYVMNV